MVETLGCPFLYFDICQSNIFAELNKWKHAYNLWLVMFDDKKTQLNLRLNLLKLLVEFYNPQQTGRG
jgi:hypothetical protein